MIFSQVFHSFVLIWLFQHEELYFRRLDLQSLNLRYKKHNTSLTQINILEAYWWLLICFPAIFLFRFLPFGDCFYSTLPIPSIGENRFSRYILLKFKFSSCFRKHFAKIPLGYYRLLLFLLLLLWLLL